jgi:hypothetical protein
VVAQLAATARTISLDLRGWVYGTSIHERELDPDRCKSCSDLKIDHTIAGVCVRAQWFSETALCPRGWGMLSHAAASGSCKQKMREGGDVMSVRDVLLYASTLAGQGEFLHTLLFRVVASLA